MFYSHCPKPVGIICVTHELFVLLVTCKYINNVIMYFYVFSDISKSNKILNEKNGFHIDNE